MIQNKEKRRETKGTTQNQPKLPKTTKNNPKQDLN